MKDRLKETSKSRSGEGFFIIKKRGDHHGGVEHVHKDSAPRGDQARQMGIEAERNVLHFE